MLLCAEEGKDCKPETIGWETLDIVYAHKGPGPI